MLVAIFSGGSFAAFLTYLTMRHKFSGRVDVTEAQELWDEARALRKEARDELQSARTEHKLEMAEVKLDLLRCRANAHDIRNQMLRLHFAHDEGTPAEIKERLLAESARHVDELRLVIEIESAKVQRFLANPKESFV